MAVTDTTACRHRRAGSTILQHNLGVPLNPQQIKSAEARQAAAAQDMSPAVRLVAGPGTGKSASIEQRYLCLLQAGVRPRRIYGVSFTRAASKDLYLRVSAFCSQNGINLGKADLRVTTLHSLALAALQKANKLRAYPVRPVVLDDWDVPNVFDAEFCISSGYKSERTQEIRREREAFWVTGQWNPANYTQPTPPITNTEHQAFDGFHRATTHSYACVLPGSIVRECVDLIAKGKLDPVAELDLEHLIVDEYQDLNPLDIEFIDHMAVAGANVFVAGDDDQSIYAFRFASPAGIQDFFTRHPGAGDHLLDACFRSAPRPVASANALIAQYSPPARIPKTLTSLWAGATPPVNGVVCRWEFKKDKDEASAIADSASALIAAGVPANEIMLLLSNSRMFPVLENALKASKVPFLAPKEQSWVDTEGGRFVLGILRSVVSSGQDYVAYRLILGCRRGVGPKTCHQIVDRTVQNKLTYGDLFTSPLPANTFDQRQASALRIAAAICIAVSTWTPNDDLALRAADLRAFISGARPAKDLSEWDGLVNSLPPGMTLGELQDYLMADNADQRRAILVSVHARLALPPPAKMTESGVRVLTMHGAKGLQAKVVFIPGLEEYLLPGPRRSADEGARLLYVSITRARAAVVLSYANGRYYGGTWKGRAPSQYCAHLGGPFGKRFSGLVATDVKAITSAIAAMQ
jgi:ATP-dependent DNA helicase UvrD/PcrA